MWVMRDKNKKWYKLIRNVIYCPDFRVNLYSPQRDRKDNNTSVVFSDDCHLDLSDGTRLPFRAEDGMYKMYYTPPENANALGSDSVEIPDKTTPEWLWHRRMGHQGFEKLRMLPASSVGATVKISTEQARQHAKECNICPQARMKAKPHSKNETPTIRTKSYGDRIHMDLAGPLRESFQKKFRYVSLFLDEHTGHMGM